MHFQVVQEHIELMTVDQTLEQHREKIIDRWFNATIDTYPEDTARMFSRAKNRFDNPVGSATRQSLEDTFNLILADPSPDAVEAALDTVIRIRAVQSFTASRAVGFVFMLKDIVRDLHGAPLDDQFHAKMDRVGLAAFNRYMKCREEIFLLKATEAKKRIHGAFKRAGLVKELDEDELTGSDKS